MVHPTGVSEKFEILQNETIDHSRTIWPVNNSFYHYLSSFIIIKRVFISYLSIPAFFYFFQVTTHRLRYLVSRRYNSQTICYYILHYHQINLSYNYRSSYYFEYVPDDLISFKASILFLVIITNFTSVQNLLKYIKYSFLQN